ncbi:glycosyltransferase N-terminal domain-containing protein [Rhodovulum visakhapatnamense]|uniref:3-deoxy-D-manno-octulosonic acid transferase n=2 Tax=Rhodovulum visakhapatnamense TaxID=364297 RepID=A0ABS1RIK0_9RHOB|nr:3-deoxy-D-manno-octulosonic acid transferase [Rhodovulum visakhapatnamense]
MPPLVRSAPSVALLGYRLVLTLAAPGLALRLLREGARARERLGLAGPRGALEPRAPTVWLHGASNGELASARPLIERLLVRRPDLMLVVTCNTLTGRALVAGWNLPRVAVRLAPYDYVWTLRRFAARWQPRALILIESELWPNRLCEMARQGRPVLVAGARLSARSAARWGRLPGLARRLTGAIRFLSAQDAGSRDRFAALGLPGNRIGPVIDLKAFAPAPAPDPDELARLAPCLPRERTVLAASTHEGEEVPVLAAFAARYRADPGARLILAPRHPRRAPEIAALIARAGLDHATRSKGETPGPARPVLLADTMGEMALWVALAGTSFVGGSLVPKGGHTPFEPAAGGSAILHGPHVANFADTYAKLDRAGAAIPVTGAEDLAAALAALDGPEQSRRAALAQRTIAALRAEAPGPDTLVDALDRLLTAPDAKDPCNG